MQTTMVSQIITGVPSISEHYILRLVPALEDLWVGLSSPNTLSGTVGTATLTPVT